MKWDVAARRSRWSSTAAPFAEVVHEGDAGGGFDTMPIPISTPGFDNAPYLSSAHAITRSPVNGIRNVGHYRGQIKSPTTCGVFFTGAAKHGYIHWDQARQADRPLEMAFVVGAPSSRVLRRGQPGPVWSRAGTAVAGGLAGEPIELVRCRSVDLETRARGDRDRGRRGGRARARLEPEGPFGEWAGSVHPRSLSPLFEITCVTHRRDYCWTSFISQVTPSESSVIKKVSLEPTLLRFLRVTLGIAGVRAVVTREQLTESPQGHLRPVRLAPADRGVAGAEGPRRLSRGDRQGRDRRG